jgi:tRNA threonylcarbamoyladenosine biosynthesis protein TsaB
MRQEAQVLILAIDCSSRLCAVAIHAAGGDRILARASPEIGRGHAERLPDILMSVCSDANVELSALSRIGVTIGPGSFAGIRVGVAFARGLALALEVPVVGVGSLEAIAIPSARTLARPVMAVLDARRDRVWTLTAAADGGIAVPGAEMTPVAAAAQARDHDCRLRGNGGVLLTGIDPELIPHLIGDCAAPDIAEVARLAAALDPQTNPAEPRYLREADAKPQIGFALPHETA